MATLVLQAAGSVLGNLVGGPIGGAIGSVIGASLGTAVDQTLLQAAGQAGGGRRITQGPRLKDLDGISATEGAPVPRVYGRARLGGQVIWATRFEEEAVASASKPRGGKGFSSMQPKASVSVQYRYFANVAIGLCAGEIAFVRRIWADGKELDLTGLTLRVHTGSENQAADPLIVAKQGAAGAPAYRGLAYVVFERLPLERFGNRLPQLTFEVVRAVHGIAKQIRAMNIIPGAGEYVYEPRAVSRTSALGASRLPNRTQLTHGTDWHASLDALQALCPNLENVSLVVAWFGDDLRCGYATVRPLVEPGSVDGHPHVWSVAGLTRATAGRVSSPGGKPALGGTPSDASVIRAIRDLKARGLKVTLYPFVMMDVPADNARPDPWTGAAAQPAYPWRGRITCDPAPGRPGSVDGTMAAEAQIAAFMGACVASQFSSSADSVTYAGAGEWTLSRLVLHCAALAQSAGGVDALVIGSEFVGLTRVRGASSTNPAVAGLQALAAEVRAMLGPQTKITYGADWTEYGAESRAGGDVRFPLDPLWTDPNIDAVAIDWYPPVTDWRDGLGHIDAAAYDGAHDPRMFAERIAGGEGFDWYYADAAGRHAQARLPITDGAYGKPWTYRVKDLVGWWSNAHVPRTAGVEATQPTAWVPGSKPIWLLECGGPAVDRGANAPNMFSDPKSAESGLPPFSRGARDDLAQSRLIAATLARFDPGVEGFQPTANPVATAYAGRMVDPSRCYAWCWDARPFPAFPDHGGVWGDAENWHVGHWLNGRLEGMPADDLIGDLLSDFGVTAPVHAQTGAFLDGYVVDRPMSARAALEPLVDLFAIDATVSGGVLKFRRRGRRSDIAVAGDALAVDRDRPKIAILRRQASEMPAAFNLGYVDGERDYRRGAVRAQVADPASGREAAAEIAAALPPAMALHRAEVMLAEARGQRDTAVFRLPWSRADVEPGDVVTLEGIEWRVLRITDGAFREVTAVRTASALYLGAPQTPRSAARAAPALAGPPVAVVLDLAAQEREPAALSRIAVSAQPWAGGYVLWRSEPEGGFVAEAAVPTRAMIGRTTAPLPAGPLWRFDRGAALEIELSHGQLQSMTETASLAGANLIAVQSSGGWEILSFAGAELTGVDRWRLTGLVRGLKGSEPYAAVGKATGAQVVILDDAVQPLASGAGALGAPTVWRVSPEGRDHADPMAIEFTATPGSEALLPLAPVGLRAKRSASGVMLSWIRRTRTGGDSWELAEVPLGEEAEAYMVEIMAGPLVKRSIETGAPFCLYATAEELADFGAAQASLKVRIRQISRAAGPGRPDERLLIVG